MSKLRSIFTAIAVFLIACNAWAQTGGAYLSGRVVDSKNHGIGKATVRLTADRDSSITMKAATGDDGSFKFSGLADGRYDISVTCVGYESQTRRADVKGNTNVGKIRLEDAYKMLDGVTVMANYTDAINGRDRGDLYIISAFTNRYLKPRDYLKLSFGLKFQIL